MNETAVKLPPAQPPEVTTAAGTADQPPICPEKGAPCSRGCKLPLSTGRTYCWNWIDRVREEGRQEQSQRATPQPGR